MMQARLKASFPQSPTTAGFNLDVDFSAEPGVTVLYGPSASGKTLTLDCIAGFVQPGSGRILLDDQLLFDGVAGVNLPPRDRHCGYVFQDYALFPHMTVRENLAFAAERRPRLDRHRFVAEMLDRFRLTEFAGHYPAPDLGWTATALLHRAGACRQTQASAAGRAVASTRC